LAARIAPLTGLGNANSPRSASKRESVAKVVHTFPSGAESSRTSEIGDAAAEGTLAGNCPRVGLLLPPWTRLPRRRHAIPISLLNAHPGNGPDVATDLITVLLFSGVLSVSVVLLARLERLVRFARTGLPRAYSDADRYAYAYAYRGHYL
jgi:hypothetical protein